MLCHTLSVPWLPKECKPVDQQFTDVALHFNAEGWGWLAGPGGWRARVHLQGFGLQIMQY